MATTGRNRGDAAAGNIEKNLGADQRINQEGPSFEAPQQHAAQPAPETPSYVEPVPTGVDPEAEARAKAEAAARAKARAEAQASAQRQANDRKIAKDAQEAQANRNAPQARQAAAMSTPASTVANLQSRIENEGITVAPNGEMHDGQGNILGEELRQQLQQHANELDFVNDPNDFEYEYDNGQLMSARPKRKTQRGKQILGANQPAPGQQTAANEASAASAAVDNATGQGQQQGSQQQSGKQQQAQQQREPKPMRDQIDEWAREMFYSRNRQARNKNESLYRQVAEGSISQDQFDASYDQEAFGNMLRPVGYQNYRSNAEYEAARQAREEGEPIPESGEQRGTGSAVKDTHKLDRLLDQTVWDMRVGFFHVQSERLVEDKETGASHIEWSRRVENAMNTLMEDFDGSGIDGQRTVFRMVRLYATMAIDRQGKMFNQDKNEWSLTQDEFVDICNCMHRSIQIYGHPFVAPAFLVSAGAQRTSLRGTDMFPSGVIPRVVAEAITGEYSAIRFPQGHPKAGQPMTADELIDACRDEWINRTQPTMNATLVNSNAYKPKRKNKDGEEVKERNLVAQRIAIENALQAFARLDGMDAQAFGSRFNVDTAQHYKLAEYRDQLVEYATAMNGKYDAEAVKDRLEKKAAAAERKKNRNRKKATEFEVACNIFTSGIKTNALWWNLPIRTSAIAEKGSGNLQTYLTLGLLRDRYANADQYEISQEITEAFKTSEGYEAIDAAYLLLEIGGPSALSDFASSGHPMNHGEAIKYLTENVLNAPSSERAAQIQELQIKFNKFNQKILAGDHAFRRSDVTNFFNALMISNQAIADTQEKLAARGDIDTYAGLSLTGAEMMDVFQANNGDVSRFLSEVMTTSAGKDALIMMKSNNIAQFNAVSYGVNSWLRDHGIGNAAITAFVDSFATYGVNFLYAMIPFSRTFTYLGLKRAEGRGDINAADLAIGGGLGARTQGLRFTEDPGFYNGLKMNLMFDAMSIGKWAAGAILIGGTLVALGFEPPDDPNDVINISKWKIGGNVGFGPDTNADGRGNGIEIQDAYWLNDLTQWGLPIGYLAAVAFTLPDDAVINDLTKSQIMQGTLIDSISNQFDGNVVLDIGDCIINWGDDLTDLQQTMNDPTHEMENPSPFFAMSELGLRAFGKMVPGAPLVRAYSTSALLRGPNARMFSTNKVFDKSSEWAIDVGKTEYIDDPVERLLRKYSAGNYLLGAILDMGNNLSANPEKRTGYQWWEMPIRTKTEPYALVLAEAQKVDYDHMEPGETKESYNAKCVDRLKDMIAERGYDTPEEAIRDGFFITHDFRYAALDSVFSELNALQNEFDAKCDAQAFEYKSDYYDAKDALNARKNELWDFINDWLKNDDIPTWMENYEQLLSDWDVTYLKADGSPATVLDWNIDRLFNQGQGVEAKWKLKGNHPTALLPFTTVDYSSNEIVQRGASGETVPYWVNKDSNLTSYANIEALGDAVIPVGRDAGSTVNDVYFGEEHDGKRWHEGDITAGERGWVPKTAKLPDDIRNFDEESASGGIYGDLGKKAGGDGDGNGNKTGNSQNPWKQDYGPNDKLPWKNSGYSGRGYYRSFYPRRSYHRRSSGSNYEPKIYSNPRSINSDRAATMYTKTPQSTRNNTYLRPSFSTKGSREAYKRQDF